MKKKIVFASGNIGKYQELKQMMSACEVDLVMQSDLGVGSVAETGLSFIENAIIKARHASKITGLPALADDSGLEVAALNGAPGLYSARYAGQKANFDDNMNKLLAELATVEKMAQRQARFVCSLALINSEYDATPEVYFGFWPGFIAKEKSGVKGFGYDPVFYLPEYECTAAELSLQKKQIISHRAKALKLLIKDLQNK